MTARVFLVRHQIAETGWATTEPGGSERYSATVSLTVLRHRSLTWASVPE
jgi:hypothetical protein